MKNILKWFFGLIMIAAMLTGLEMAKFALLSPGPIDPDGPPQWHGAPPSETFNRSRPDMDEHPEFGTPPPNMEFRFALADATNLLMYVVILIPLLYIALQFGKRAFNLPRFNTVTRSASDDSLTPRNEKRSSEPALDADVALSASDEYSLLDNHLLDQLL